MSPEVTFLREFRVPELSFLKLGLTSFLAQVAILIHFKLNIQTARKWDYGRGREGGPREWWFQVLLFW